jgi:hypothetical protein
MIFSNDVCLPQRAVLLALGMILSFMTVSRAAAESNEDLRAELEALRLRVTELEAHLEGRIGDVAASKGPELTLGGQYRINSYTAENDMGAAREGHQTASRVRIRQNVDLRFDERFKTHLQLELGHTNDNLITTNFSSRGNVIAVRHAVLDYTLDEGINFRAGIVPLSDRFGDTLFSADWDYNPVALSMVAPLLGGTVRAFAGNLGVGDVTGAANYMHANYGIGGTFRLTDSLVLRSFVVGSHTDRQLLGTSGDADGVAAKIEVTSDAGFGLMATHATGDSDGSGFLPIMALATTNGYWGYTGILTVQGPTDTGFDGDSVNISNNGFGLTTVQAKYARPLTESLDLYLAAGWFGNTDGPGSRDSLVGIDTLAMGTYHFNEVLALDFGAAYARLSDSVSGYSNGVIGGASFNQPVDRERNKYALFTRLQAEF